jgi:hypothetical protein
MAGCERQPNARLRNRGLNAHVWAGTFGIGVEQRR